MKLLQWKLTLWLWLWVTAFAPLQSQSIKIQPGNPARISGNALQILEDPEGKLTPSEAWQSKEYKNSEAEVPNLNITNHTFWVKFNISNEDSIESGAFMMVVPTIDRLDLFEASPEGIRLLRSMGDQVPIHQVEDGQVNLIHFIPPGKKDAQFLIKMKCTEQLMVPFFTGNGISIIQEMSVKDSFFLLYAGIMLVMFLYNFFIWIRTQDRTYLYYILYILTVLLTQACLEGYARKLIWGNNPWFSQFAVYFFSALIGITAIQFLRIFLNTKQHLPKMDKVLRAFNMLYSLTIILALFGLYNQSYQLILALAMISAFFALTVAIILSRRNHSEARFFLIAWSFFIICVWVYVLKDFGLIPYNLLSANALQIGSAFEAVLLSVALADRIKQLQQKIIDMAKEETSKLERMVNKRTAELAETVDNLKKTQAQLVNSEKMASLGQLTAGIAHEMNNPINFVSSNINPLKRDIEDLFLIIETYKKSHQASDIQASLQYALQKEKEIDLPYITQEIQQLLKGITEGATRTAEIVKGLRVFSRLDEADKKAADINEGIISTLNLLGNQTRDEIQVDLELANLPLIECYPGKLNQVFMNILSNAIQAIKAANMPTGEGKIKVKTYLNDQELHIEMSDNGPGIPKDIADKIFDPFFTTKPVGEGTGLGLSIAFSIIEKHHGHLRVHSQPGDGTTFYIVIPAVNSAM